MNMFASLITALIPVISLVALGKVLRSTEFISEQGWDGINKLAVSLLVPATIFYSLARVDLRTVSWSGATLVLLASTLAMFAFGGLLYTVSVRGGHLSKASWTTILQLSTRWNAFVVLAVVLDIFGQKGVAVLAAGMAVTLPTINILIIVIMSVTLTGKRPTLHEVIARVFSNPIVLSCLLGILLGPFAGAMPRPFLASVKVVIDASLGVSLICVGAGLEFSGLLRPTPELMTACALKLLVMPAFVFCLSMLLALPATAFYVALLAAAIPSASNGYHLAREMGGDATLYANGVAAQSLAALASLPLTLLLASPFVGQIR